MREALVRWRGVGHATAGQQRWQALAAALRQAQQTAQAAQSVFDNIHVQPFSVLGTQLHEDNKITTKPTDATTVIVDPAGDPIFARGEDAGGASGAIYAQYGSPPEWTTEQEARLKAGFAVAHTYTNGVVIHVIGPKIHSADTKNTFLHDLTQRYVSVLQTFCSLTQQELRLLPISTGLFCTCKEVKPQLPSITASAVQQALRHLSIQELHTLQSKTLNMCIYLKTEYELYKEAFDKLRQTSTR